MWCSCAVQGLFFGDFLLAPQKKVTPLPGGTPGNPTSKRPLSKSNLSTHHAQSAIKTRSAPLKLSDPETTTRSPTDNPDSTSTRSNDLAPSLTATFSA